jgi:hypothetical protein
LLEGVVHSVGSVVTNLSADQMIALVETLGVHPSYFFDRGRKLCIIDRQAVEIFRDETDSAIVHKIAKDLERNLSARFLKIHRRFITVHHNGYKIQCVSASRIRRQRAVRRGERAGISGGLSA